MKLVLTCEHAGNKIPQAFTWLFQDSKEILKTHRGYDPGALDLFNYISELASYKRFNKESRLLIEVNRSMHHPHLFSEFTGTLPKDKKSYLVHTYYLPYRENIENAISEFQIKREEVVHLSIHSFTPVLDGKVRNADIGLLYDPARKAEKDFCKKMKKEIQERNNSLKIRFNYPYRGTSDGFTTCLRKRFPEKYIGIEVEVNQKFTVRNKIDHSIKSAIFSAVESLINK